MPVIDLLAFNQYYKDEWNQGPYTCKWCHWYWAGGKPPSRADGGHHGTVAMRFPTSSLNVAVHLMNGAGFLLH